MPPVMKALLREKSGSKCPQRDAIKQMKRMAMVYSTALVSMEVLKWSRPS